MTLQEITRYEKAKMIAKSGLVAILNRDKTQRPTVLRVPGSEGKMYQVIIRRFKGLSVECNLEMGHLGHKPCNEGNQKIVCYHALAGLLSVIPHKVLVCTTKEDADRLSHLGGKIYAAAPPVRSAPSTGAG